MERKEGVVKMNARRIKCILSGGHRYRDSDTQSYCDDKKKECTITEKCYKCGKKSSFTAPYKNFGIPE